MSSYAAQLTAGLIVLVVYLVLMVFVASNYIRLANFRWLQAHQAALRGRLKVQTADPEPAPAAEAALRAIEALIPEEEPGTGGIRTLWGTKSWIGSCEIGAWVRLHEAQRLEVWRLPDHVVQARFARAMGQIDELSAVRQNAWQRRWVELQDVGDPNPAAIRRWRAELSQLLAELFNARDSTYNQLVSLYGKAAWLLVAAYLPVIALLVAGYGYVLLAGFLGGLISRMQRVVYGRGRPTAYGTSWVPLFLAPLLGALAAWAGLHFLALLQVLGVVNLDAVVVPGETFRVAPPVAVLGLAVLFGFSERFFNQIGNQADKVIGGDDDSGSAAAAGSPTYSFRPAYSPSYPPTDPPNGSSNGHRAPQPALAETGASDPSSAVELSAASAPSAS
jgi:hypothetical protein